MHPHTFYSTLYQHQKRDEVFVIMSFAPEFEDRWHRVIEPCIREDLKLTPNRVDFNRSGESVVHDILDGIAHARLVIADITSSTMTDAAGKAWPQRNGNVMWELGIAHTMRVPDEVLVVRSDSDPTIFDLTQFRAFPYNPRSVSGARADLAELAKDRLKAVEQAATDHVRRCAASLDYPAWSALSNAAAMNGISPPIIRTMGQVMGNMSLIPAIARLLNIGALATSFVSITPEAIKSFGDGPAEQMMKYQVTPFGEAILRCSIERMGLMGPNAQAMMEELARETEGRAKQRDAST